MSKSNRKSFVVVFLATLAILAGCATPPDASNDSGEGTQAEPKQTTDAPSEPTEEGPDYDAEEDTSPTAAPVLEARAVAPAEDAKKEATTRADIEIIEKAKKDPVANQADPAPRDLVTSFQLAYATGRNRGAGFTSGVGVEPYASEVYDVAPTLPPAAAQQYKLWFLEPFRTTLAAYQEKYGGLLRAERFDVDGERVYLLVFARAEKTEYAVSIYDQRYFYTAVAFSSEDDVELEPRWAVDLSPLFEPYRELDDIQLGPDGTLYVNSNYQSYAKEVGGETAYFYAIAPGQAEVLWKAGPVVSRGDFLVLDDVILTGYGFTAEPDYLFALDAETGAVLDKERVPTAHERMRETDEGIQVVTYNSLLRVEIERGEE
ncbi:MAG: hypothetical protein ACQEVA_03570 [Myxococcota bacterium]